jgi:hypothetical protein
VTLHAASPLSHTRGEWNMPCLWAVCCSSLSGLAFLRTPSYFIYSSVTCFFLSLILHCWVCPGWCLLCDLPFSPLDLLCEKAKIIHLMMIQGLSWGCLIMVSVPDSMPCN